MAYVLIRTTDGAFVARKGSASSYTNKLQHAEVYSTKESANNDRCPENEQSVHIDDILRRRG